MGAGSSGGPAGGDTGRGWSSCAEGGGESAPRGQVGVAGAGGAVRGGEVGPGAGGEVRDECGEGEGDWRGDVGGVQVHCKGGLDHGEP